MIKKKAASRTRLRLVTIVILFRRKKIHIRRKSFNQPQAYSTNPFNFFSEKRRSIVMDTFTRLLEGLNLDTRSLGGLKRDNCQLTNLQGKRIRDAAFFLIIMLVTFAATLLNPQKYVSSRTIQKCVEHVSTST